MSLLSRRKVFCDQGRTADINFSWQVAQLWTLMPALPVCARAEVACTHLDVILHACLANGQPCTREWKTLEGSIFSWCCNTPSPILLSQWNSSFLEFLLKPVFGNVNLKQWSSWVFLSAKWVHSGAAKNCNLGHATVANHMQVQFSKGETPLSGDGEVGSV